MLESQLVRKKEIERERKEGRKERRDGKGRKEDNQQVSRTSLENLCLKELKPFFKTRENRFSCLVFHKNIS